MSNDSPKELPHLLQSCHLWLSYTCRRVPRVHGPTKQDCSKCARNPSKIWSRWRLFHPKKVLYLSNSIYICYEGTLWLICGVGDLNGIHWRTNALEPLDPFDSLAIRSLHNVRGHWIGLLTRMLRKLEGMMLVLSMAHLRPVACSLRT